MDGFPLSTRTSSSHAWKECEGRSIFSSALWLKRRATTRYRRLRALSRRCHARRRYAPVLRAGLHRRLGRALVATALEASSRSKSSFSEFPASTHLFGKQRLKLLNILGCVSMTDEQRVRSFYDNQVLN